MIFLSTLLRRSAATRSHLPISSSRRKVRVFSTTGGDDVDRDTALKSDTSHDDDDSSLIVSQFKNRIVHELWTARAKAKKEGRGKPLGGISIVAPPNQLGKTPCQSETKVEYPFTSDPLLAENYRSPWNTMRLGKVFEDFDALAGNIAFYHVRNETESDAVHPLIVTASVDRIRLRKEPSKTLESDQVLSGRVTFVGTSSMEIRMHCTGAGDDEPWLEAFFTFVTLDPETKKPINITPLLPQTEQEQADFDAGAKRAAIKKARRKQHKDATASQDLQQHAKELLKQARPLLLNMPSLAARDSLQMSSTKMQNAMIAQPQSQNLHNRIFGGFLMRRAFELAFCNAYVFGGARPVFQEVDEVSFNAPVDVGDLLVFNSRVLYTSSNHDEVTVGGYPLVHVEVEAWVTVPEQADAKLSNQFYFTFAIVGNETTPPLRRILPANIDEATRMARRMEADRDQAESDKQ